MTEAERRRGLAALEELRKLREEPLAASDDEPAPSSVELIREMREERTRHLMSVLESGRDRRR
jgi:hypothetical protein